MNYSSNFSSNFSSRRGFPAGNPIANAIVIIVGALAIGASIVLGFLAFVVLASVFVVFSAIVGLRLWWFNRRLRRRRDSGGPGSQQPPAEVIEGEYRVVVTERDERPDA
ncbi:MAG: hypothetical protein R3288_06090 [Woeseiaceae bacterium]|nr:hypothetical protein [Woeseiaceae bacterium]